MSFFVSRAVTPNGQDRADIFARGEVAVLALADGAGGLADGGAAADLAMARVRDAVIDARFDLLAPRAWVALFAELDHEVAKAGETTLVVVVLSPGMLVCAASGDSEAWILQADAVLELSDGDNRARLGSGRSHPHAIARPELVGRLVVASDGLFRHVPANAIITHLRSAPWSGLADSLVDLARLPSGQFADDVAVLVAER